MRTEIFDIDKNWMRYALELMTYSIVIFFFIEGLLYINEKIREFLPNKLQFTNKFLNNLIYLEKNEFWTKKKKKFWTNLI